MSDMRLPSSAEREDMIRVVSGRIRELLSAEGAMGGVSESGIKDVVLATGGSEGKGVESVVASGSFGDVVRGLRGDDKGIDVSLSDLDYFGGSAGGVAAREVVRKNYRSAGTEYKSDVGYRGDTYRVGGKSGTFRRVSWDGELDLSGLDAGHVGSNLYELKRRVTGLLLDAFGGVRSVRSVGVFGGRLVINGICYSPGGGIDLSGCALPLDTREYFEQGLMAYFFDWDNLKGMVNLSSMLVDEYSFFIDYIGSDVGMGYSFGIETVFNMCGSLRELGVGDDFVTRDDLYRMESAGMKRRVLSLRRFREFSDGYKFSVYPLFNKFQDTMFKSMADYYGNRGSRGIFRHVGGTLARFGLWGISGVLNMGVHAVGGLGGMIKDAFSGD